ncbi:hypothetical protein AURDEDRAFT_185889 [Auricularia subglabra TFB-10046 SS5]|nr:hypothetical protein AURDEDRAFT_185889 [Auricularia subglabra TFB-10046 SS5]
MKLADRIQQLSNESSRSGDSDGICVRPCPAHTSLRIPDAAMYSDSDDEYGADGSLITFRDERPHLRLLRTIERRKKSEMYRKICDERTRVYGNRRWGDDIPSDREMMRERLEAPDMLPWDDWRRWRVVRFFREIQGFHKGALDLTGRAQTRYEALMRTFWSLVSDMQALAPLVTMIDIEREEPPAGYKALEFIKKTVSVPSVSDPVAWSALRTKWKLPRTVDYEDLTNHLEETYRVLVESPVPKFQRLWLADLPPEVVIIVFEHATIEEARSLSATCRYLRDVGLTYIYTTRQIFMSWPLGLFQLLASPETDFVKQQVHALVVASRDKCIREIDFLGSRPDIRARVRRISAGNTWSSGLYRGSEVGDVLGSALASPVYVRAFIQRLADLLPQLSGLEALSLHRLQIDLDLVLQISRHPRLANLDVKYCGTPPALWEHVLSSPPGSLQATVEALTLDLHHREDLLDTFSGWNILAFCPNLRLLRVNALDAKQGFDVPEQRFWPHMTCIAHIEYLHLQGFTWTRVSELSDWLVQVAPRAGGLRITHLKLHSAWGIPDAMVGQLLHALHDGHAPLRVLALDGIKATDATLFDTLGQLFPSLEGLTLVRRANDRQAVSKLCRWPLPVYEYAQRMEGLTRLRHFGANFYWEHGNVSPAALRRLEPAYSADHDPDRFGWDLMADGHSVGLPFAVHCPALETFAITSDWVIYAAQIRRSATGAIEMQSLGQRLKFPELDQWNPCKSSMNAWQLPRRKNDA